MRFDFLGSRLLKKIAPHSAIYGMIFPYFIRAHNIQKKFAVAVKKKKKLVGGHLPKGKTGRFAKTIFYFLKSCDDNCCYVKVTGKAMNQGGGMGMKVPCKLLFSAEEKFLRIFRFQLCKQEHT